MMSHLKALWKCMFTPRLIWLYDNGNKAYEPLSTEKWGDRMLNSLYVLWKIGIYTSPFLAGVLYRKGYFMQDGLITLTKLVTGLGVILIVSLCVRSYGRTSNHHYLKFLGILQDAQNSFTPLSKQRLSKYDFEFFGWPIEYKWSDVDSDLSKHRINISSSIVSRNFFDHVLTIPYQIVAYVAIITFGIRLIYPGSLAVLKSLLAQSLSQGRANLVQVYNGVRYKLETRDNNHIDVMHIDRRSVTNKGNTLVICCEGNAGFYEIGIMTTPIKAGYSVLGWNHPGFAGSTGDPFPEQEQNAIDIVMQFAINKLGYKIENIILFGWSIGGYSASWAAMNYPDIKGVILDATFDDIMPLAINHMPTWFEPLVKIAVRKYANLHNYEQLSKYPGPILLIRRTEDEVIAIREGDLSSNRGNYLLVNLLRYRYPLVFDDNQTKLLEEYLSVTSGDQNSLLQKYHVDVDLCKSLLESYISENSKSYPMRIGYEMKENQKNQMALFLAERYIKDYDSSHCTPLPEELFEMPWDLYVESDYVFT